MREKIGKEVAGSDLRPHGMAQMGPECKLCTEMYYFLNTTVAHKGDFGAQQGPGLPTGPRPDLRFP